MWLSSFPVLLRGVSVHSISDRGNKETASSLPRVCGFVGIIGYLLYQGYYNWNGNRAPVTGRRRWIGLSFYNEWVSLISIVGAIKIYTQYGFRILDDSHPASKLVRRVGQRIVRASADRNFSKATMPPFSFYVVWSYQVNAFVLPEPDGQISIFISTGLLRCIQSEDELGFILGHEVAHSVCQHLCEHLTLLVFSTIVKGLLQTVWPSILARFLTYTKQFVERPLSRQKEYEADLVGMHLAVAAGYDHIASQLILARLQREDESRHRIPWIQTTLPYIPFPEFFSTHPCWDNRIARLNLHAPEALTSAMCSRAHLDKKASKKDLSILRDQMACSPHLRYGWWIDFADNPKDLFPWWIHFTLSLFGLDIQALLKLSWLTITQRPKTTHCMQIRQAETDSHTAYAEAHSSQCVSKDFEEEGLFL